jgi:DNA-binding transcriptional regulator YhcF (GntR family)
VIVTVDARSPVPPYEQLRQQLLTMIRSGVLLAGSQLPPIRQLAKDLSVANGTVARAYAELERDGLVTARGRHGTVVAAAASSPPTAERERQRLLEAAAHAFVLEARRLGAGHTEAIDAVRAALEP